MSSFVKAGGPANDAGKIIHARKDSSGGTHNQMCNLKNNSLLQSKRNSRKGKSFGEFEKRNKTII